MAHLPPKIDWLEIANQCGLIDDYPISLIEIAVNRIEHGDVTDTRFGTRVALREDLQDNRGRAKAYWPDNGGCKCYRKKSTGQCSHEVAAKLRARGRG